MKAEEFRLGNLIFYHIEDKFDEHKEWDEVSPIDYSDLRVLVIYEDNSEYKPIPLTEEWLLKFGFDERIDILKDKYFELGIDAEYGASFVASKNEKGLWEVYLTDCDGGKIGDSKTYIHQFQNLYFALTGEELTIK